MTALTSDPLQATYDALERHGAGPAGPVHKFTARCPVHDDRSPSLSVREGADGRALIWCHAGCATEAVIAALGLQWADLHPPGSRHARRSPILARPAATREPVDSSYRRSARTGSPTALRAARTCGWPSAARAARSSTPLSRGHFGSSARMSVAPEPHPVAILAALLDIGQVVT
jgi:hypothetical protein